MSPEVMERAFSLLNGGPGPFRVQLGGGEPTLAPGLIRLSAGFFEKAKAKGRPGSLALQTNATNLDRAAVSLIKELGLEVGVSLDGPPEVNEPQRGGTRKLLRGLALLSDNGIPFNVTAVVTEESARTLPELPLLLSGFPTAKALGLDLLVGKGRGGASPPAPHELEKAALALAQRLSDVNRLRRAPLILRELELVRDAARRGARPFCEACRRRSLAVTPDGSLFPCGQAARDPGLAMGTVFSREPPQEELEAGDLAGPHCRGCPLEGRCPGDCPTRLRYNQGNPRLACSLYRGLAASIPGLP
jgi:uncharacterized protein